MHCMFDVLSSCLYKCTYFSLMFIANCFCWRTHSMGCHQHTQLTVYRPLNKSDKWGILKFFKSQRLFNCKNKFHRLHQYRFSLWTKSFQILGFLFLRALYFWSFHRLLKMLYSQTLLTWVKGLSDIFGTVVLPQALRSWIWLAQHYHVG